MRLEWIFLILYGVAGIVNLVIWGLKGNRKGNYVTKPFLMSLLLGYYILVAPEINILIVVALILALVGDVLLMFQEKRTLFAFGLGLFLTCHVMYILAFVQPFERILQAPVWAYFLVIPYAVYGFFIFRHLAPSLKDLKAPVMVYIIVIMVMGYFAVLRLWAYPQLQALLPFIGSLFFMGSDTILSIHTFKTKIKYAFFYLMLLYLGAQFLIVQGFVI